MRFEFNDHHALAAGRYLRAAEFPMVHPAITLASYEGLIQLTFDKLPFLTPTEEAAIREMLRRVLEYMMCLPASSTFHHRTAGGLFFHSLETAPLAIEACHKGYTPMKATESSLLTAFVGGLLHDFGKVVSLYHVHPHLADLQDIGFGQLEETARDMEMWDPYEGSLWSWATALGVTHLTLRYQTSPEIGHEAVLRNGFWRTCVPNEVLEAIEQRAPSDLARLERFMEGSRRNDPVHQVVKEADRTSVSRDTNSLYRSSPKRSDLHAVRRFVEFAALSPWNNTNAPFVMADIWSQGEDLKMRVPLFRTGWPFFRTFREYLQIEDRYGAAFQHDAEDWVLATLLEKHGVLSRALPGTAVRASEDHHNASFSAALHFPGQDEGDITYEPLSYFPHGAMLSWLRLPSVRAIL